MMEKVSKAIETVCPVCGVQSYYIAATDHCYHLWGEDNIPCWQKILMDEGRPFQHELERMLAQVRP